MAERRRNLKESVRAKLILLEDFYVIDPDEEDQYRKMLYAAVEKEPGTDYDIILDRIAKNLISEKLGRCM